ncbi:glycerophosphodiester phosphodiesterase [Pedobacter sp.]|uniref:glycerophosphodiester phosphodiesterase n=1 Tax=Pedobacter sp. TaxID=1411316 RepID=UPI003D7FE187
MKLFLPVLWCFSLFSSAVVAQSTVWNDNPVIAHRGAYKKNNLPENSIASLKQAIQLHCYGAEFDVHLTKDNVLVINHDDNFKGLTIATSTYKELKKLRLSNGEKIPTLKQYLLEGKKQHQTKMILEIKPDKDPQRMQKITDACVAMVHQLKAKEWVEYIGFDYASMQRVLVMDPTAKVAYLGGSVPLEKLKADGFAGADYYFSAYKTGDWFTKAKQLGLTLNAWTVNKPADLQWLLDNDIDFITTNEPEMLLEMLKK